MLCIPVMTAVASYLRTLTMAAGIWQQIGLHCKRYDAQHVLLAQLAAVTLQRLKVFCVGHWEAPIKHL